MKPVLMGGDMHIYRLRWAGCLIILLLGITAVSTTTTTHTISAAPTTLLLDWTFLGDTKGESLGTMVALAGDVNGDAHDDIIIGSPKDSTAEGKVGSVRAFYSTLGGLPAQPNWTTNSDQSGSLFGQTISRAGDVNNDTYDDIIIGAPHYKNRQRDVHISTWAAKMV
jgi:hypothetical protein